MNQREIRIMWTSILAPILIVIGVTLLVLGSIPVKNSIEDNTLSVHFVIGKKKSGHFKNTKTKNKYIFYLTGNGERVYFEIGDKKYLVDNMHN